MREKYILQKPLHEPFHRIRYRIMKELVPVRYLLWCLALFCLLALTGCGQKEPGDTGAGMESPANNAEGAMIETAPSGEYVPVAEFTILPASETSAFYNNICLYMNGDVIYLKGEDYEDKQLEELFGEPGRHLKRVTRLYAVATDGTGMPRELAKADEDMNVSLFFTDQEHNLYLYGYRYEEGSFLKKISAEGREIWEVNPLETQEAVYVRAGCVDGDGNIALITADDEGTAVALLFLDSAGRFRNQSASLDEFISPHHITNNIVYAGQKYYIWNIDHYSSISLWEIDFQEGTVSGKSTVDISSKPCDLCRIAAQRRRMGIYGVFAV